MLLQVAGCAGELAQVHRLGGAVRVSGGRVSAVLGKLALRLTHTASLDYWRRPLTESSVPALGDILRYQARGPVCPRRATRCWASAPPSR